jgi:hypothetical protein
MNQNTEDKLIICELSDYAAAYYGNFMASLFDMEKKLTEKNINNKMIYTFYKDTEEREWAKEMRQNNKDIYFREPLKITILQQFHNKIFCVNYFINFY